MTKPQSLIQTLCEKLNIDVPIVQAPIGPAASPALVAAVSNAGGLGMIAGSVVEASQLDTVIKAVRGLTDRPFGVNLITALDWQERFDVIKANDVPILSTFWGLAPDLATAAKSEGMTLFHTVGSADEAVQAAAADVDILVCQGREAGGHVWGRESWLTTIPEILESGVTQPILAAGAITHGRAMAAALALGASGVWMGTRFLASHESAAAETYKQRLLKTKASDTELGALFDVGWPGAQARFIKNSTYQTWMAAGSPAAGERPGEGDIVATMENGFEIPRYFVDIPVEGIIGDTEPMVHYAGQGAAAINDVEPAAAIVRKTFSDAKDILGV